MLKVFIKTYGCSFNQLDSQIMAGNLKKEGYQLVDDESLADYVIVNSCSVKNGSEAKFFNDINKYTKLNKKVIAAGCVPQAESNYLNTKLKNIPTIGVNQLKKVGDVISSLEKKGEVLQILDKTFKRLNEEERKDREKIRLSNYKIKTNSLIEIIPINEGCLNACSFCKTKGARGNLLSYSIESIKDRFEKAVGEGAKEIWLTSQDTGCYGFDIGTNLPNLLKELLKIEGDYKIRIGMGNPNHFIKIIDDVVEIMKDDDRVYKFLHIPMQSGSNRILKEMKRGYTIEDFINVIKRAKKVDSKITFANDIIVAYPTETKEEFKETIDVMKKVETNVLNFSRFWLRPGTAAERMYEKKDFIDGAESKRRAIKLKEEFEKIAIKNNEEWIGWEGEVLLVEEGKKGTNSIIGRNNYYKPIVLLNPNGKYKKGDKVKVKIEEVTWFDIRGRILED